MTSTTHTPGGTVSARLAERGKRQARADRAPKEWGVMDRATIEQRRASALMALATTAAKDAARKFRRRPDWARIEDAAATVWEASYKASGRDCVAALAACGVADNPTAIAAAIGGRIAPVRAMVDGARRYLRSQADTERADDLAEIAAMGGDLEQREHATAAVAERRFRLQGIDSTAAPCTREVIEAIETAYPGHRNKSIRVALLSALSGGRSPDLSGYLGISEAGVRQAVLRGSAALARTLRAPEGSAAHTLAWRNIEAVLTADGSSGRYADREQRDAAEILAAMDSTVNAGMSGSRADRRAPGTHRAPAAALRAALRAEPREPLHFRRAHDRRPRRYRPAFGDTVAAGGGILPRGFAAPSPAAA